MAYLGSQQSQNVRLDGHNLAPEGRMYPEVFSFIHLSFDPALENFDSELGHVCYDTKISFSDSAKADR